MPYTPDTYWKRVQEVNPNADHIIPISQYTKIKESITCKCTICDYVWTTKAESLINKKSGCPSCRNSKPITADNYKERIKEKNKNYDNFIFLSSYKGRKQPLEIKCQKCGNEWKTKIDSLMSGKGCPKCAGNQSPTNEEFINKVYDINPNIAVLEPYINRNVHLLCKCKICDYEWKSSPANILQGSRCPVCANKRVVKDINSVWALRPDLIQFFKDESDSYKYTLGSEQVVLTKCPLCGFEKKMKVERLTHEGFSCNKCGDNISYPNKYCRAVLSQLPIENFITEYTPEWGKGRAYDNYFEYQGEKYILEADGSFHYMDNPINKQTVEQSRYIDKMKDDLAQKHNINVIRIDCRESTSDYISQNIIKSELSNMFDLSRLDWNKCDEFASRNLYKTICDDFNNSLLTSTELVEKYKLSLSTINRVLNKGIILGWCSKDTVELRRALCKQKSNHRKTVVKLIDQYDNCVKNYNSIIECVKDLRNILNDSISIYQVRRSIYDNVNIYGYKICKG